MPIHLRIVGYDYSGLVSPRFPTIVVEGEMGGEDWDETSDAPDSELDIRQIFGTVSMLHDGSVRWSLVCTSCIRIYASRFSSAPLITGVNE